MIRNFELPGRSVALGRTGMAATSHATATLTAVEVLKAGGNAVDAAVAACAVQCVVEAGSTGIGGDCFALLAPGGGDRVVAYNGSGRAPAAMTPERLAGLGVTAIERRSPHAVTIPGAVDAWTRLVADHGRMTMAELLAPAVAMARAGYPVTPRVAYDIADERDHLAADPTAAATFLVDGAAPAVGSIQRQPALADTLERIGREGRDAFYRGEIAAEMVATLAGRGGLHTLGDFETAAGEYVTPVASTFRGHTVHECPPNGQGVIALLIMRILERQPAGGGPVDPATIATEIRATRFAYAVRDRLLADGADPHGLAAELLDEALVADLADRVARGESGLGAAPPVGAPHRDTVYIAVVDKDRTAVSFINSIFYHYGSGIMTPRSGIMLHNRGCSFTLEPGHPNTVAPRKRPLHTIIPGMVTRNGRAVMPFGVMGGHYQAMGQAVFLSRLFGHGCSVQEALDLPRVFPLPGSAAVEAEGLVRDRAGVVLAAMGFDLVPADGPIGGGQAIWIDPDTGTLIGGSDHRKDGMALGY